MADAPVSGSRPPDASQARDAVAWRGSSSRVEFLLLCALLFALPLFEVPKQLLWLGWVAAWFGARGSTAFRTGAWLPEERALLAFGLSAVVAGAFSGHWSDSALSGADTLRIVLAGLLIARGEYTPEQMLGALSAGLAGTLAATIWGAWRLATLAEPGFLELNSVGHVNHSAIYLGIGLAIAVGRALACRSLRSAEGAFAVVSVLALGTALLVSASRAAIGASACFLVLLAWLDPRPDRGRPDRRGFRLAIAGAVGIVVVLYGLSVATAPRSLQPPGAGFSEKFESRFTPGGLLAFRDKLWRVAVIAFASEPVFGIGNDRFGTLTPQGLCGTAPPADDPPRRPDEAVRPADNRIGWTGIDPCDETRLYFKPHAHSLYANVLAERGAAGLIAVVTLLGVWARGLLVLRTAARQDRRMAALWCFSLGAWCLSALAGLLNTTLHHEHGLLAMIAFGALAAMRRQSVFGERPSAAIPADVES